MCHCGCFERAGATALCHQNRPLGAGCGAELQLAPPQAEQPTPTAPPPSQRGRTYTNRALPRYWLLFNPVPPTLHTYPSRKTPKLLLVQTSCGKQSYSGSATWVEWSKHGRVPRTTTSASPWKPRSRKSSSIAPECSRLLSRRRTAWVWLRYHITAAKLRSASGLPHSSAELRSPIRSSRPGTAGHDRPRTLSAACGGGGGGGGA
jgi:hypothetical protein